MRKESQERKNGRTQRGKDEVMDCDKVENKKIKKE